MVVDADPLAAVRALHLALERGESGSPLQRYFTDDVETHEYPNRIKPAGAVMDLAALLRDSERGSGLLRAQRYDVQQGFSVGHTAIVRLTWTGEIAVDVGPFVAGQVLKAHIAQFVETRDGRIRSIATYDCYEPF
jgi:ketosteroid isomerase-like protein